MAAVVNVLRFKEPVDPGLFHRAQDELGETMRAIAGFQALHIVETSDTEVVLSSARRPTSSIASPPRSVRPG